MKSRRAFCHSYISSLRFWLAATMTLYEILYYIYLPLTCPRQRQQWEIVSIMRKLWLGCSIVMRNPELFSLQSFFTVIHHVPNVTHDCWPISLAHRDALNDRRSVQGIVSYCTIAKYDTVFRSMCFERHNLLVGWQKRKNTGNNIRNWWTEK